MFDDFKLLHLFFIIFWFCLFIFTLYMELKLRLFSLISYSLAALLTAILGIIFASVPEQLFIFIGFSFVFSIFVHPINKRRRIKRIFENQITTYIGREATVSKTIQPDKIGELKFYNIFWEAVPAGDYVLEEGEVVLITGKSGVNLVASKIKNRNSTVPN